jgi:hypothetical protein
MKRWLLLAVATAFPTAAHAKFVASLRGGYTFDDAIPGLSDAVVPIGETPQASSLGLGLTYEVPQGNPLQD